MGFDGNCIIEKFKNDQWKACHQRIRLFLKYTKTKSEEIYKIIKEKKIFIHL